MAKRKKLQPEAASEAPLKDRTEAALQISAEISVLRGVYSNVAVIRHSYTEFILEFMLRTPEGTNLVSRVLTSPNHMKRLVEAMYQNVTRYEAKFGTIPKDPPEVSDNPPIR